MKAKLFCRCLQEAGTGAWGLYKGSFQQVSWAKDHVADANDSSLVAGFLGLLRGRLAAR